jgi:hypothetical protein
MIPQLSQTIRERHTTQRESAIQEKGVTMNKRPKFYFTSILAAVVLTLTQFGCGSKTENSASTAQPSASPNNLTAQATAAPTIEGGASMAGAPNAAPGASAGGVSAPAGSSTDKAAGSAGVAPIPAPTPRVFTLAAGAPITIYTAKTLSTKTARDGERFSASLARPIVDDDWVVAKRGALVEGVVVNSDPGGRVKGRATMTVELRSLQLSDGRTVNLASSGYTKEAKGTKKKDAMKIGIGAGIGAAIGAIAGGGKGAAIGAGAGGGAGTGYVLATRGDPAVIPSESQLTFRLRSPITVTQR